MSDLLADTAALVDIPSVSRDEQFLADVVERSLRDRAHLVVTRVENNLVARTQFGRSARVTLAGHLDTVPPSGNDRARIDGDRCFGRGAGDMKGGLAVLLDLASNESSPDVDVTYVFYACEEIARSESGLLAIEAAHPKLLACDAAILLEPTGTFVEAGCQGVVRASVELVGKRAHTARPWIGSNAIHRLPQVIEAVRAFPEREPTIDACTYHEVMQAVKVSGGVAANVVPDRCHLEVAMRFAPDRSLEQAVQFLSSYLEQVVDRSLGDRVQIVDSAVAAAPQLSNPTLSALLSASGKPPRAKLGWTDVAFFAERNIPATNFGPGDPELAHSDGEFVSRPELEMVRDVLRSILYH